MESLPALLVATYVIGLRSNSRIKLKMAGLKYGINTVLLAMLVDRMSGRKDESDLLAPKFMENVKPKKDSEAITFESVDDFKQAMQEFDSRMED